MADRHAEFVALLEPHRDALWRVARRSSRDAASAEDCLQDAIAVALEKFDGFERGTNFRAWIFRILVNTALNRNARLRRELERLAADADVDLVAALEREQAYDSVLADPGRVLEQLSDPVRRALAALGPAEHTVFLLRAVEGFTYREVADLLGMPMGTVMSHLFRARRRLRGALADHVRDPARATP